MVADIPSIDSNPEVIRFGRLIQNYRARISELAELRARGMMADGAGDAEQRAASMLAGGQFTAQRSPESIADEMIVVRAAIARAEAAERDARAQAAIAISAQCRLPEQAGQLRENIAVAIDGLLDALAAADRFADKLAMADISATGARWPGCGDQALIAMLAGLRLDTGVAAADAHELERRAGRRGEAVIELQARPAPAKPTMRRKIVDTIGEMIAG